MVERICAYGSARSSAAAPVCGDKAFREQVRSIWTRQDDALKRLGDRGARRIIEAGQIPGYVGTVVDPVT